MAARRTQPPFETIPNQDVRRLMVRAQGLQRRLKLPRGKAGALALIRHLDYSQIDTISVVLRAHHHILWTRQSDYREPMLDELQANDRAIFEHWCPFHFYNAAAFMPMQSYRYCLPNIRSARKLGYRKFLTENRRLASEVLRRIRAEGALSTSAFEAPDGFQRGPWWHHKPAKRMLEALLTSGKLMVSHRRNFKRYYDLTERVLPANIDTREPSPREMAAALLGHSLRNYGFSTTKQWRVHHREQLRAVAQDWVDSGRAVWMRAQSDEGEELLIDRAALSSNSDSPEPVIHILSPFDPLIRYRDTTEQFFDFFYRIECYTPAPKRTHGYFSLPILYGDRIMGRMDSTADRAAKLLRVHTVHFEKTARPDDDFVARFAHKLMQFAAINGCDEIAIAKTFPAKYRARIIAQLKHA
jgi:uncharacterized protein